MPLYSARCCRGWENSISYAAISACHSKAKNPCWTKKIEVGNLSNNTAGLDGLTAFSLCGSSDIDFLLPLAYQMSAR